MSDWPQYVTKPQHYWPFCKTQNYSDQGSVGGLTLTAQGSGNSFDTNGLNFNGSGYANLSSYNADVNDLGDTWSIILEYRTPSDVGEVQATDDNGSGTYGSWMLQSNNLAHAYTIDTTFRNVAWADSGLGTTLHQIIWTLSGGTSKVYIDGVLQTPRSTASGTAKPTTAILTVGAESDGGSKCPNGSYIRRFGILKGTAWTPAEVGWLYTSFNPDPYWPSYVQKPQHLWPFAQTGDYSDQGAVGGLGLTAQGSGNSFTADGLVLNGSGKADVANDPDLADLDGDYSILMEFVLDGGGGDLPRVNCGVSSTGWQTFYIDTSNMAGLELLNVDGFYKSSYPLSGANQLIFTYESATGAIKLYRNGDYVTGETSFTQEVETTAAFTVGNIGETSTNKRVGVLKGHAWTPNEVAQIYQAFNPVEYWPTGIAMPDHYWPFNETGDYSDLGAIGDLTLTAQGSGNSFDANGLNLNGSGWASGPNDADVSDLGDNFSIIIDFYLGSLGTYMPFGTTSYYFDADVSGGVMIFSYSDHKLYMRTINPENTLNEVVSGSVVNAETLYQLIWVQDSGTIKVYLNNSSVIDSSLTSPLEQITYGFGVGACAYQGGFKLPNGSYIKRCGILKGIAWTSDDVEQIFNFFQQGELNVYSRGSYNTLPTDDADLATIYSSSEHTQVATDDGDRVGQYFTATYAIHQFKEVATSNAVDLTWNGQSTIAPSTKTVYLQIYNRNSNEWETIDSDGSSPADTDFNLEAEIIGLTDYVDVDNVISCRVYQAQ